MLIWLDLVIVFSLLRRDIESVKKNIKENLKKTYSSDTSHTSGKGPVKDKKRNYPRIPRVSCSLDTDSTQKYNDPQSHARKESWSNSSPKETRNSKWHGYNSVYLVLQVYVWDHQFTSVWIPHGSLGNRMTCNESNRTLLNSAIPRLWLFILLYILHTPLWSWGDLGQRPACRVRRGASSRRHSLGWHSREQRTGVWTHPPQWSTQRCEVTCCSARGNMPSYTGVERSLFYYYYHLKGETGGVGTIRLSEVPSDVR